MKRLVVLGLLFFSAGCGPQLTNANVNGGEISDVLAMRWGERDQKALQISRAHCARNGRTLSNFSGRVTGAMTGNIDGLVDRFTFTCSAHTPPNSSTPAPQSATIELDDLVSSDCRSRGLSRGTARWSRCEQEARTFYAASGNLHDPAATRRILSDHAVADGRCFSAGLRRGTTEFETCAIQARANLRSEAYASDQAAMATRLDADRQQAIEMARAEAERARREERNLRMMQLGLGMAAGASSAPPPPQTRTYIINGRPFHCSTTGAITNCF